MLVHHRENVFSGHTQLSWKWSFIIYMARKRRFRNTLRENNSLTYLFRHALQPQGDLSNIKKVGTEFALSKSSVNARQMSVEERAGRGRSGSCFPATSARSSTDICLAFTLDLDKANSVPTFLMLLKSPCGAPFCHKAAAP